MIGKQLLIDAFDCDLEKINNKKRVRAFLDNLVTEIGMKRLSKVYAYRAVKGEPDGVTAFVVITTSHISIHTFVPTEHFWLDVFSCRDFNEKKVLKLVMGEFDVKEENINYQIVKRKSKNGRNKLNV